MQTPRLSCPTYSIRSAKIGAEVVVLLLMHLLSMVAARVLSPAIITPAWWEVHSHHLSTRPKSKVNFNYMVCLRPPCLPDSVRNAHKRCVQAHGPEDLGPTRTSDGQRCTHFQERILGSPEFICTGCSSPISTQMFS